MKFFQTATELPQDDFYYNNDINDSLNHSNKEIMRMIIIFIEIRILTVILKNFTIIIIIK